MPKKRKWLSIATSSQSQLEHTILLTNQIYKYLSMLIPQCLCNSSMLKIAKFQRSSCLVANSAILCISIQEQSMACSLRSRGKNQDLTGLNLTSAIIPLGKLSQAALSYTAAIWGDKNTYDSSRFIVRATLRKYM